ncbi:MAG: hypothetical protein QXP38_05635 [Nitrososphaerota archaeon]
MLDGDEECMGDVASGIEKVRKSHDDAFSVRIHDLERNTWAWRIRFYRWQSNMRYEENHWTVKGNRYEIYYVSADPPKYPRINDFYIINHEKSPERKKMNEKYYTYMALRDWRE